MKSSHYTRTLALPPRDGEETARAEVEAFLTKCPDRMPIHVRIKDEGIDVRGNTTHRQSFSG
jgi:hypothetical protein